MRLYKHNFKVFPSQLKSRPITHTRAHTATVIPHSRGNATPPFVKGTVSKAEALSSQHKRKKPRKASDKCNILLHQALREMNKANYVVGL